MEKAIAQRNEIKLVGISLRTNNANESNPATSKIAKLAKQYQSNKTQKKIPNRSNPGVTFSVYTNYESDEHGDYTYFIGEEVSSFEALPENLEALTIPASVYQVFTTGPGEMPWVVINAWSEIWKMSDADFGGKRTYQADFEIYDHRAANPNMTVVDIYIGIK